MRTARMFFFWWGGSKYNRGNCKVETAAKPLLDKKPWVLKEVGRIWCHLRDWSGYHIYFKINDLLRVDNASHMSLARPDMMQDSSLEKKQKQMEILATTHFNVEGAAEYYPALRSVFFCFMFCLVLFSYVHTWKSRRTVAYTQKKTRHRFFCEKPYFCWKAFKDIV